MKKTNTPYPSYLNNQNDISIETVPFPCFKGKIYMLYDKYDFIITNCNTAFIKLLNIPNLRIPIKLEELFNCDEIKKIWLRHIISSFKKSQNISFNFNCNTNNVIRFKVAISPNKNSNFTGTIERLNNSININKTLIPKIKTDNFQLYSIIAHDIKGPIIASYKLLELCLNDKQISELTKNEIINEVIKSCKNTYHLIENILQWSLYKDKRIFPQKDYINLNNIIDFNIHLLNNLIKQKKLHIEYPIAEEIYLYADENMTSLIIRNLLSNAIKFSYEKHKITFNVYKEEEYLTIEIKDCGIGISPDNIELLLNSDKYLSLKGTNNEQGYGLGLQICKEFIRLNNGILHIESEINKGSTFVVKFPFYKPY